MQNSVAFQALQEHLSTIRNLDMSILFKDDLGRKQDFTLSYDGLEFDYSKNKITGRTLELLFNFARSISLERQRNKLFSGAPLNVTEDRPVLHTALRGSCTDDLDVDGLNIKRYVAKNLEKMEAFVQQIHAKKRFTDIVHIGIGGSDFGPHLVCNALGHLAVRGIKIHFMSNIDPDHVHDTLSGLNPKKTLFIIASKSFATQETMANAQSARHWLRTKIKIKDLPNHFCAVTGNHSAAKDFGVMPERIFDLPDWVGGRFSLWSTIGLPIALYIGMDNFRSLLAGARSADEHFQSAPLERNIPTIMALLGFWYRNLWNYHASCVLPYTSRLSMLPTYIQQLDMESNGKSVDIFGNPVTHPTAPVIFGSTGTNAQHTFFQLLHQGTDIIPCDFIALRKPVHPLGNHHEKLISNVIGQTNALMVGRKNSEEPHKNFEGNRPSNTVWLDELTPYKLGLLLAFYEHKVFIQGIIWQINSFDQYGVELGKELADKALEKMKKD